MESSKFTSGGTSYYYWDFYDADNPSTANHCKKVSYSVQAPIYANSAYTNGYTANSRGGLAIMADKTPEFDGETATTDWTVDDIADATRKAGMSQNHNAGDFINVLYADAHVGGGNRADVGISNDNIYSASNDADEGTQGAGTTTLTNHLSREDSFLVGPTK